MTVYASTVLFTQSSFAMAASKRASVATICSCCAAILSTFALSCPIPSLELSRSQHRLPVGLDEAGCALGYVPAGGPTARKGRWSQRTAMRPKRTRYRLCRAREDGFPPAAEIANFALDGDKRSKCKANDLAVEGAPRG